ncbi:MAG TPA: helix-turn-helix transcriptional regulator [Acidimicrobiales bacterium]|nr:helix-turn-helix transcriptional regulator [Acidimicrobiales bacterium]
MTDDSPEDVAERLLAAGWGALEKRDLEGARRSFEAALLTGKHNGDDAEAYEGLGWVAWWANDAEALFPARERAYALYRKQGDPVAAARQAVWLGCDHHDFRGEHAVANGWHQRARRLLEGLPPTPEHGWLAFQEGAFAIELEDDTATALARAEDVAEIGRQLGLADLQFLGLGLAGLALVTKGRIDEGMARLDEVGVAATTGELEDRIATTWMMCYLIYACERVRDLDRASQWCQRMRETSEGSGSLFANGVCRAHYGGVLVYHGRWEQAEAELVASGDLLKRIRPPAACESWARLGELRRRQGRVDDAAELFARSEPHPMAVVGQACLALEAGHPARAAEPLDDLLAAIPQASLTQRADALELLVRARVALRDEPAARSAAAALQAIADTVGSSSLRAMALCAGAHVATLAGDDDHARRGLEQAVELFERSVLPFEAECARIELARALARLQRAETATRHARRAADRLRALGALYTAQRAEEAVRAAGGGSVGSRPQARPASPLRELSAREREVLALLTEGLSDRAIGERLHISAHTAHRHVSNILTKLGVHTRAAAAALGARHGVS